MQNRFVGDIGDFGKYGLLRCIARSGFTLGFNWYLTEDGSDSAGNLIDYLKDSHKEYLECDPILFTELGKLVQGNTRTVGAIESSGLFSRETKYYSVLLKSNKKYRGLWFQESLKYLEDCQIIFLDPDNNILMNATGADYSKQGSKYAFATEVEQYYRQGHSVIVYNHANRQDEKEYFGRFGFIRTNRVFNDSKTVIMKYNRHQVRYYLLVIRPEHQAKLEMCLNDMIRGPWGQKWKWPKPHFQKIELSF